MISENDIHYGYFTIFNASNVLKLPINTLKLYIVLFTLYIVLFTLYIVLFTLYIVLFTLYIVLFTLYIHVLYQVAIGLCFTDLHTFIHMIFCPKQRTNHNFNYYI